MSERESAFDYQSDGTLTHAGAQHFCRILSQQSVDLNKPGLVVGFGKGHEASYIGGVLGRKIIGIDLQMVIADMHHDDFVPTIANACDIPFADQSFGFILCHHVLEHISDPPTALADMARVLCHDGFLYIGTPNRHRLVGYIGSHNATKYQKIHANLTDYRARIKGRFRNEAGAHAGFTNGELSSMLLPYFRDAKWLTRDYIQFKYGSLLPQKLLNFVTLKFIMEFAAPAIYILCKK